MQNRALGLALEREKQKAAGLSADLQKAQTIGNVPMPGTSDPQVVTQHVLCHHSIGSAFSHLPYLHWTASTQTGTCAIHSYCTDTVQGFDGIQLASI